MELKGIVCGLAFDKSFASSGHAFIGLVINEDESEQIGEFLFIRYHLEKLPPFQVTNRRPDVILRANCIKKSVSFRSIANSNKIEIQGLQSPPEAFDSNVRSERRGEQTYHISFGNNDESRPDSEKFTSEQSLPDQRNDEILKKELLNESARGITYDGTAIAEAQNARLMVLPNGKIVAVASEIVSDLALTDKQIVGIATGPDREPLFFSRHSLFALTRLTALDKDGGLPTKLSMTGWFSSIAEQKFKPGFISIGNNTNSGEDGATSRSWIRIPNHQAIEIGCNGVLVYPPGTLLLQTISIEKHRNTDTATHRETRVLLKTSSDWELFTYRWLHDQSDAELVDNSRDSPSADDMEEWQIPARKDCIECHHRLSSNMVVGFSARTLNSRVEGPQGMVTHFDLWKETGLLTRPTQYNLPIRDKEETRIRLAGWEPRSRTAELGIDWDWLRSSAIDDNLKHWLDASPTPNGFFHVHLDGTWQPIAPAEGTVVSQSCLTYVMAEGYRLTKDPRFLEATVRGADFLLAHFHDPRNGGYWWSANGAGVALDRTKTSYGHAFAVFALA
ncbi:MAG: AGE family epimerase/isomerase, partial [Planctomycetes bacterium]|nr:AGE family epimerase/isomerase [Planctomycetota bacterium]